jgi:hypothetical protein
MSRGRDALITSTALTSYGLLHLPCAEAADVLSVGRVEQGWDWSVVATRQPLSDTLDYLDTVTWPATRYVLFPLCDRWTVIVNNQRGGTEVADLLGSIRHRHAATAVRVVDQDESFIVQNGFRVRQQYAARMVSIQAGGETTRSVTCADDGGRWVFETSGEPLPVEESFNYEARRKRDRFTRHNLDTLLRSIGARRVIAEDLAETRHFTLLAATPRNKEWRKRIESEALTTTEAADPARGYFTRGATWVERMETHATSVVADFGRAVLLNPAFESRCRPALEQARAQLGNEAFEAEMARAEAGLRRSR